MPDRSNYRLLMMHGTGKVISPLIRHFTRCQFAHAALHVGGGWVIEAWPPKVRVHRLSSWEGVHAFDSADLKLRDWQRVERLMRLQVGKPYDYGAVMRFATGWQRDKDAMNDKWFCFELVHMALRLTGFPVVDIADCRVHGGHFEASMDWDETPLPT